MILHTVNKLAALEDCLRLAPPGGGVILIEDAVLAAVDTPANRRRLEALDKRHEFYILSPDLAARGLEGRAMSLFEQVDYGRFVELCVQYARIQSWY